MQCNVDSAEKKRDQHLIDLVYPIVDAIWKTVLLKPIHETEHPLDQTIQSPATQRIYCSHPLHIGHNVGQNVQETLVISVLFKLLSTPFSVSGLK